MIEGIKIKLFDGRNYTRVFCSIFAFLNWIQDNKENPERFCKELDGVLSLDFEVQVIADTSHTQKVEGLFEVLCKEIDMIASSSNSVNLENTENVVYYNFIEER